MQIKSVLEMHDFSGINRKVQLKKGNSSKALAETESEAEDTSKYFFSTGRYISTEIWNCSAMHLKILKTLLWKTQKFSNLLQSKLKNFVDIPWILLLFNAAQPDAGRIQVIVGIFFAAKSLFVKGWVFVGDKSCRRGCYKARRGCMVQGTESSKDPTRGSQAPA